MGILDTITTMKSEGKSEAEIIQTLRNQRVPPKEIQDALSRAQIKSAVAGGSQIDDMQESIMDTPPSPRPEENDNVYTPSPKNQPYAPSQYAPQSYESYAPQEYAAPQQQYPQAQQPYYSQDQYTYAPEAQIQDPYAYAQQDYATQDSETVIDVAEQVFSEKIKPLQEAIDPLKEFHALAQTKLTAMEERLKRLEQTIDQLQSAILDKIGSYGSNLNTIKKEMAMMQDSFGKVINPLLDKQRRPFKRL